MTLEIRIFKKDTMIAHQEAFNPEPDALIRLYNALLALSEADIITGFVLNIDTYSPHMED